MALEPLSSKATKLTQNQEWGSNDLAHASHGLVLALDHGGRLVELFLHLDRALIRAWSQSNKAHSFRGGAMYIRNTPAWPWNL